MARLRATLRLALFFVVAAAIVAVGALPSAAADPVTLRLGVFPNVTHAPGLVAIESGLLEKQLGSGVKLEVKYFNSGTTAQQALAAGALDASYIGPNPAINLYALNKGIRIIAGSTSGGAFLVVKPGITKVADLKGKKIATPSLGNTQDVAARAFLKTKGLKTDAAGGGDVNLLPQANATTLDAFKQGLIDGAWVPEPWASRLVDEAGGKVLVDEADLWPNGRFVTTHLIANASYIKANPAVVKNLVTANVDAVDFVRNQRTVAEKLVNDGIFRGTGQKVEPATITASWENLEFTVDPISTSLVKSAKDAVTVGLLQPVNLKGIYDLKFLNQALKAKKQTPVKAPLKAST